MLSGIFTSAWLPDSRRWLDDVSVLLKILLGTCPPAQAPKAPTNPAVGARSRAVTGNGSFPTIPGGWRQP